MQRLPGNPPDPPKWTQCAYFHPGICKAQRHRAGLALQTHLWQV